MDTHRKYVRPTSNKGKLFFEDLFELSLGNAVSVEDNAFGRLVGLLLFKVGSIVDEFGDHILRDNKSAKCCDGDNSARGTLVIRFKSSTISTRDS